MLGPGAWSVDARLFGWKRIDLQDGRIKSSTTFELVPPPVKGIPAVSDMVSTVTPSRVVSRRTGSTMRT